MIVFLELLKTRRIQIIVSLSVGDGHLNDLSLGIAARKGGVCVLNFQCLLPADEAEAAVWQHGPRQKSSLEEDLKAVADSKHEAPFFRKLPHLIHDR